MDSGQTFSATAALESAAKVETSTVSVAAGQSHGMIRIQGDAELAPIADAVKIVAGLALPEPGQLLQGDTKRLHWLTPKEWLLVTSEDEDFAIAASLNKEFAGGPALATVISDSRVTIEVNGADAATLLMQGCALDLHTINFPVSSSTVTRLGGVAAMISCLGDQSFELIVDRPLARYIWDWLIDSVKGL